MVQELTMGEVRIPVLLTNIVDQINASTGLLPATDTVRTYTGHAVVDTGAVCSVLPQHVADILGAQVLGQRRAQYADGRSEVVNVVGPLQFEINGRTTLEEALVLGNEVLIGQTVLEKMDWLVDCTNTNRKLVGNPAHQDEQIFMVR